MDVKIGFIELAFNDSQKVPPLGTHQLLKTTSLQLKLSFDDMSTGDLAAARNAASGEYTATLDPTVHAKATRLDLDFRVSLTHAGKTYTPLLLVQRFALRRPQKLDVVPPDGAKAPAKGTATPKAPLFLLDPVGWVVPTVSGPRIRIAPLRHPLVTQDQTASHHIRLNPLILDVTELWMDVHGTAPRYVRRKMLSDAKQVTLRVLAHLGQTPLVWFAVVPRVVSAGGPVSPIVFYEAEDYGAVTYEQNSLQGLINKNHSQPWVDGAGRARDEGAVVMSDLLLPPLADDRVQATLQGLGPNPSDLVKRAVNGLRNVTNVSVTGQQLTPQYWEIPTGMEAALVALKHNAVLFFPQKQQGFSYARAQRKSLTEILETSLAVLWTHSQLIDTKGTTPMTVEKFVLAAYSESGVALWDAATSNIDRVKGIIAIEPQNMHEAEVVGGSTTGDLCIPKLLKSGVKVVLIGRHKKDKYHPKVAAGVLGQISLLPDDTSGKDADGLDKVDYATVWKYPPDVAANAWMTYRTFRLAHPDKDPFMDPEQLKLLDDFISARRKAKQKKAKVETPPVTVTDQEIVDALFRQELTQDNGHNWYLHQFAIGGGRKLRLPPKDAAKGYYGVGVTAKTFFHEALEIIG